MNTTNDAPVFSHTPVLLGECIEGLAIKPGGTYVDCTLGGGGHSFEIAKRLSAGGRLIAVDRDAEAIAAATVRLEPFADRVTLVHRNFFDIAQILEELGVDGIDGALADLGVSSFQLDTSRRGFSYQHDAPLDMRMDESASFSAYDLVNSYPQERLTRILRDYGEERFASRIAAAIVRRRETEPLRSTGELAALVCAAVPAKFHTDGHPARRTFQAIRIEVNGELAVIAPTMQHLIDVLRPGGRLAVITFHSLEDRIVKETLKEAANGCTCPRDFPVCVCGKVPKIDILTKKPITAGEAELASNYRAHSAKLRIGQKRSGVSPAHV